MKKDYAYSKSDAELFELTRKIIRIYGKAHKDLEKKVNELFADFVAEDTEKLALVNDGKMTQAEYLRWRFTTICQAKSTEALCKEVGERVAKADKVAAAYINDTTPSLVSLNHNYAAYTIERKGYEHVSFSLFDEATVRNLIKNDPELLPPCKVNLPKAIKWNQKRMTREITSGILQGESLDKIAKRLENVTGMGSNAAIKNARTACTAAQNAGRQIGYEEAAEMGVKVRKRWMATKDGRTRDRHRSLDGEIVEVNERFSNGCRYPGDPQGPPSEVYNCRCTMSTVEPEGIEAEPRKIRVRDPKTGKNVIVNEMTYAQWEAWKRDAD